MSSKLNTVSKSSMHLIKGDSYQQLSYSSPLLAWPTFGSAAVSAHGGVYHCHRDSEMERTYYLLMCCTFPAIDNNRNTGK